jgi:predicted short-subunit dehydrogenase-like oxidoreductase (DUF2520 family)
MLDAPGQEITDSEPRADLILLCVSDDAVSLLCNEISVGADLSHTAVAHCAGALDLTPLAAASAAGARTGKLHPLASLSGGPSRVLEIAWGVDGSESLVDDLVDLVERLYGTPLRLDRVDLSLYHLAAVFASNYVVGLFGAATELWNLSGAPLAADRALLPLIEGCIGNLEDMGIEKALTGPIVRGDVSTIEGELRTVIENAPGLESLYRALGLVTASIAARQPKAHEERLGEISRILAKNEMVD